MPGFVMLVVVGVDGETRKLSLDSSNCCDPGRCGHPGSAERRSASVRSSWSSIRTTLAGRSGGSGRLDNCSLNPWHGDASRPGRGGGGGVFQAPGSNEPARPERLLRPVEAGTAGSAGDGMLKGSSASSCPTGCVPGGAGTPSGKSMPGFVMLVVVGVDGETRKLSLDSSNCCDPGRCGHPGSAERRSASASSSWCSIRTTFAFFCLRRRMT